MLLKWENAIIWWINQYKIHILYRSNQYLEAPLNTQLPESRLFLNKIHIFITSLAAGMEILKEVDLLWKLI
jgi:hypothetical protein